MKTKKKKQQSILSVTLYRKMDDSPDLSWIGEYTSKSGPDDKTIDRKERGDVERNEYRYFVAANSGEDTGNPESVEEDYQRMESYAAGNWCMFGIYAKAEVQIAGQVVQHIQSGGLWGIESDSKSDYLKEIEHEQLDDLRDQLKAIGFRERAIDKAFENVEHKE